MAPKNIILTCFISLIFSINAYATLPHPTPEGTEDLAEKYKLQPTTKIIINTNRFTAEITDKQDIQGMVRSFSSCNLSHDYSDMETDGKIIFYDNEKELLKMNLAFFETYSSPMCVLDKGTWYMPDAASFSKVFYKYIPEKYRKEEEEIRDKRSKGLLY